MTILKLVVADAIVSKITSVFKERDFKKGL